jgi:hypothetical protein
MDEYLYIKIFNYLPLQSLANVFNVCSAWRRLLLLSLEYHPKIQQLCKLNDVWECHEFVDIILWNNASLLKPIRNMPIMNEDKKLEMGVIYAVKHLCYNSLTFLFKESKRKIDMKEIIASCSHNMHNIDVLHYMHLKYEIPKTILGNLAVLEANRFTFSRNDLSDFPVLNKYISLYPGYMWMALKVHLYRERYQVLTKALTSIIKSGYKIRETTMVEDYPIEDTRSKCFGRDQYMAQNMNCFMELMRWLTATDSHVELCKMVMNNLT